MNEFEKTMRATREIVENNPDMVAKIGQDAVVGFGLMTAGTVVGLLGARKIKGAYKRAFQMSIAYHMTNDGE